MKRKWIERIQDFMVIVLNHLMLVVAAITVFGLFKKESPKLFLWIFMIIVPILLYAIRKKVENFILFYALHIAVLIVILLVPAEQLTKTVILAVGLLYFVWSIKTKMTSKSGKQGLVPIPFFIVMTGMMAIFEGTQGQKNWENYYLMLTMVYFVVYFSYLFLQRYMHFIITNEKSASNIPEKELCQNGLRQIALFSGGSIVVLVVTANFDWFSKIMSGFGDWILDLLRKIFSGMHFHEEDEAIKELPEEITDNVGGYHGHVIPEFILEILEKIITVITCVVVIVVVIGMIYLICKFIREHFLPVKEENTKTLRSNQDIRENCGVEKKEKGNKGWFGFLDNRDRVRKLYRKRILKNSDKIVGDADKQQLGYLTAKECCDRISEDALKNVYEKARYSEEEITSEDIKMAKMKV